MRPTVYTSRPRDSYPARLLRALLSAIIPGLGQLMAGVRRRGIFLLVIFAVVSLAAIIILTRGIDALVGLALQPKVLLALLFADIAILLIRLFAVIDAWLTAKTGSLKPARPSGGRAALTGLGLVLILAFTIAPHAVAGYYTIVSHNLLTTVFTDTGKTTTTTQKTTGSSGGTSGTSGTSGTTGTAGSDSTSSTAAGETLNWGSDGRMTVLLIGTDAGFGRTGARADSMNVASVDIKTGRVAMFGLPRNTSNTPLGPKTAKALGKTTYNDLLNSLYTAGSKHPEIATDGGDPGAEAVMETASIILGIKIDYYVVVDMMGLVDMVNALGGIDISLKTALHITYAPLNAGEAKKSYVFNVGINHLDGLKALAYARDRSDSDDYVRMGRQRCIIMAMLYQNSVTSLTLHFPAIASALEKSVRTNIPLGALADVIKLRSKVKTSNMITVGFTPPDWVSGYVNGTNVLDFVKIKAAVKTILNSPDSWIAAHPAVTTTGGASDCWKAAN
jgi:polyisoprenyl-teichoic acid--peptidoglycan teichoic acid transferase